MIDQLLQRLFVSFPIPSSFPPSVLRPLALLFLPTSSSSSSCCFSGSLSTELVLDRLGPSTTRLAAVPSASLNLTWTGRFYARLSEDVDVHHHTFLSIYTLHLLLKIRSTEQALPREASNERAPCFSKPRKSLLPLAVLTRQLFAACELSALIRL